MEKYKSLFEGKEDQLSFNRYDFQDIFEMLLDSSDLQTQKSIFKNLGYDENLFSYRTRVISISFHSENAIQVQNNDSFALCLDMIAR